jgi:hypothetical protein
MASGTGSGLSTRLHIQDPSRLDAKQPSEIINQMMTPTRPYYDPRPAGDEVGCPECPTIRIDAGLIDSLTEQFLAYPTPSMSQRLDPQSSFVFAAFANRSRPTGMRHYRAPSHRLRDLEMLVACANRLRHAVEQMHATDRLLLWKQIPLLSPTRLTAMRTGDGLIAFLTLLTINANARYCSLGGRGNLLPTPQTSRPHSGEPTSLGIENRLSNIASRYFGQPDLWPSLADVALSCGTYHADLTESPAPAVSTATIVQAATWAQHLIKHLHKFKFPERAELLNFDYLSGSIVEPDREPVFDHPNGKVRRLRALGRILFAIADYENLQGDRENIDNSAGRRDVSDPATFAVTSCASLWVAFTNRPLGGRLAKFGSFSLFVEEFLSEAAPVFSRAQLRTALRRFHDNREVEIGLIAKRFGKSSEPFLQKRPTRQFSNAAKS